MMSVLTPQIEQSYPEILGITANISANDLLNLTNQKRAEAGLPLLKMDNALSQAAANKANDMLTKNYWSHNAPDGTTPWVFIKSTGYEYLYAGENLARGFTTAEDAVSAWMASPGHRENILSANYKDVGFAITSGTLTGEETVLIVEEFGVRLQSEPTVSTSQSEAYVLPSISPAVTQQPVFLAQVKTTPSPTASPTTVPEVPLSTLTYNNQTGIDKPVFGASLNKEPLIDKEILKNSTAIAVVAGLLILLVTDTIIIERKKIVRLVSHNPDHILFLSFIILSLVLIMLKKGELLPAAKIILH